MNEEKKDQDDFPIQKAIEPETGRDITYEVITSRLKDLEIIADDLIKRAIKEYKQNPKRKKDIYEKTYWEIHQKLGMGSIGPATAAAGPLMYGKLEELESVLEIDDTYKI